MKVQCSVCKNEDNKKCKVKNVKIHLNKPRKCDKFIVDEARMEILEEKKKNAPTSTLRPFWYYLDRSLRKKIFEALQSPREKFRKEIEQSIDDSMFSTTASKDRDS